MRTITLNHQIARHVDLAAGREFAGSARRFSRRVLWTWCLTDLMDDVEQITGEMVANAIRGGKYRLTLLYDMHKHLLRVEVLDYCEGRPRRREPSEEDTNGRGLIIVEALADRWGYDARLDGNTVWAELDVRKAAK